MAGNRIQVLEKSVAELIAAGEVVDRPASVVKELVENSIDAGATAVTVEIRNGGTSYLRVSDNGSGMEREDIRTAFLRHATSKVRGADDLESIGTLGFRGEALASVAAVAKVELTTKTEEAFAASRIVLEGGEERFFGEAAMERGTTIIVRDLFFNTPARMKFLKKDVSESNAVAGVIDKLALSHPEISIRFIKDGKEQLFTPGDSKLLSAIYAIYGSEFAKGMIEAISTDGMIKVWGYVSHPDHSRGNRSMQNFFINGRFVRSGTCMAALSEGYKNTIMSGRFPACVLFLEMPAELVDVNVHPAKIEVRFANEKPVFDAVYFAVKNALMKLSHGEEISRGKKNPVLAAPPSQTGVQRSMNVEEYKRLVGAVPEKHRVAVSKEETGNTYLPQRFPKDDETLASPGVPYEITPKRPAVPPFVKEPAKTQASGGEYRFLFQEKKQRPEMIQQPKRPLDVTENTEPVRGRGLSIEGEEMPIQVIGELFSTYILASQGEKLLLIDKHAAHERYLFNQLRGSEMGGKHRQSVIPFPLVFSTEDYGILCENADRLASCGFTFEDLGNKTLMIHTVPMYLDLAETGSALSEIAGKLLEGKRDLESEKLNWIYESVACRSAIKAGDISDKKELEAMVRLLQKHGEITHCPHGRPITVELSRYAIEKFFGRKQ